MIPDQLAVDLLEIIVNNVVCAFGQRERPDVSVGLRRNDSSFLNTTTAIEKYDHIPHQSLVQDVLQNIVDTVEAAFLADEPKNMEKGRTGGMEFVRQDSMISLPVENELDDADCDEDLVAAAAAVMHRPNGLNIIREEDQDAEAEADRAEYRKKIRVGIELQSPRFKFSPSSIPPSPATSTSGCTTYTTGLNMTAVSPSEFSFFGETELFTSPIVFSPQTERRKVFLRVRALEACAEIINDLVSEAIVTHQFQCKRKETTNIVRVIVDELVNERLKIAIQQRAQDELRRQREEKQREEQKMAHRKRRVEYLTLPKQWFNMPTSPHIPDNLGVMEDNDNNTSKSSYTPSFLPTDSWEWSPPLSRLTPLGGFLDSQPNDQYATMSEAFNAPDKWSNRTYPVKKIFSVPEREPKVPVSQEKLIPLLRTLKQQQKDEVENSCRTSPLLHGYSAILDRTSNECNGTRITPVLNRLQRVHQKIVDSVQREPLHNPWVGVHRLIQLSREHRVNSKGYYYPQSSKKPNDMILW